MPDDGHLVPLSQNWALWRDFAIRSAGFPVSGLAVFGSGDEAAALKAVARNPRFREALAWQNRSVLGMLADLDHTSPGRRRRSEDMVASYWQRYCSKNDTIGFFGPLAWGSIATSGPALACTACGAPEEREVHLETWCLEALAEGIDPALVVPLGVHPERELRDQVERLADSGVRERGLAALDRLLAARDVAAAARGADLPAALAGIDRTFEDLTGHRAARNEDDAEGGRTPVYLDCMRATGVQVGPGLVEELSRSLPALLESSRWHCHRVFELGRERLAAVVGDDRPQPLAPLVGAIFATLGGLRGELSVEQRELQRRWAGLVNAGLDKGLAARAAEAFASEGRAWPMGVFHSPDIQIAARDAGAVEAGDFTAVVGDFHPGANPLGQGTFANRHPDRPAFLSNYAADVGSPQVILLPPRNGGVRMTARMMPAITLPSDVHVTVSPQVRMPAGYRNVGIGELVVAGEDVSDRAGSFHIALADLFFLPIFAAALRSFAPFAPAEHLARLTAGRTVLRRETWWVPIPELPEPDRMAAWARSRGWPQRVFVLAPGEARPLYVDLESPALVRLLGRVLHRAAEAEPQGMVRVTEMHPGPEDCWLEDDHGRYTSELRLVAVDLTRRAGDARR
jgi:hypothetical protein